MNPEVSDRHPTNRSSRRTTAAIGVLTSFVVFAGCSSSRSGSSSIVPVSSTTTVEVATTPPVAIDTTPAPTELPATVPITEAPTTTTIPEPTTTTIPIITEGANVIVANATKVQGGAAKLSTQLTDVGFHLGEPTNAAGSEEFVETTHIYVLPGGEAVAGSLSIILGGVAVTRMPTPAPITAATAGLGDATVLIMLGKDLAGHKPPGL